MRVALVRISGSELLSNTEIFERYKDIQQLYSDTVKLHSNGNEVLKPRGNLIDELPTRPAWQRSAACRTTRTKIFYPFDSKEDEIQFAKSICDQCEVQQQCLDYAMSRREDNGVWGGLSEEERRDIRRKQRQRRLSV